MLFTEIETVNLVSQTSWWTQINTSSIYRNLGLSGFLMQVLKKLSFESIGTLQIKVFHFRPWSLSWKLQFWQKNSFKAEISIITATLVFLINFDIYARIEENLCNRISVWECEFSLEASTAETKPVVTKKDEIQYRSKLRHFRIVGRLRQGKFYCFSNSRFR